MHENIWIISRAPEGCWSGFRNTCTYDLTFFNCYECFEPYFSILWYLIHVWAFAKPYDIESLWEKVFVVNRSIQIVSVPKQKLLVCMSKKLWVKLVTCTCTCVNNVLLLGTVSVYKYRCMYIKYVGIFHSWTMNQTTLKRGSPRFCTKSSTAQYNKGGLDGSELVINVVRIFLCHPFIHVPL